MTLLATAAWIAHDLGLATAIGGTLFGRIALHPSLGRISDERQRGQVANHAWKTFHAVQLPALGVVALSWFAGRSTLSGGEVDAESRSLTQLKDGLVIGTLATGVAAAVTGWRLGAQQRGGSVPLDSEGQTTPTAPPRAKALQRTVDVLGFANLLCGIGVVAVTTILASRAGKSGRWSLVSRLLP